MVGERWRMGWKLGQQLICRLTVWNSFKICVCLCPWEPVDSRASKKFLWARANHIAGSISICFESLPLLSYSSAGIWPYFVLVTCWNLWAAVFCTTLQFSLFLQGLTINFEHFVWENQEHFLILHIYSYTELGYNRAP